MRTNRMLSAAAILVCILLPVSGFAARNSVNERLLQAAKDGSSDQIKTLLAEGGNVHAKDNYRRTLLMNVAWSGNLDVVKFLTNRGLDVNAKTKSGETALSLAAAKNQPDIVQYLKVHGAK